ncbi:15245_t:CDS:2, partial [Funneliformis geosporum]
MLKTSNSITRGVILKKRSLQSIVPFRRFSNEYLLRSFAKLRYLVGINDEIGVLPSSIRLGYKSSGLKLRSNSFKSQ